MIRIFLTLLSLTTIRAHACEPARLHFDGTAFAKRALEIENDKLYFYRGTASELSLFYRTSQKKWCYAQENPPESRPKQACLGRKQTFLIDGRPVRNFVIRGLAGQPVAALNLSGKTLTVNFLSAKGKFLGKRLTLDSVKKEFSESLEVKAWNCPNARFLSCVGSEITSVLESEPRERPLRAVDMAKKLGHYRLSCAGITESGADAEPKRAPSSTEPEKNQSPNFN
jgi:hypothetical protein